jgi:hypothetical protein
MLTNFTVQSNIEKAGKLRQTPFPALGDVCFASGE